MVNFSSLPKKIFLYQSLNKTKFLKKRSPRSMVNFLSLLKKIFLFQSLNRKKLFKKKKNRKWEKNYMKEKVLKLLSLPKKNL